ncbi:hypothetical protein DFH09DRAFT_1214816 [Mycena vulgaris]|nr:hypothetical protein DFH09DRAFT_1214816 [Mycena vulgaris]
MGTNMDPTLVIQQVLDAFKTSQSQVESLEKTLASERTTSQDAIAEARRAAVVISLKRKVEIAGLRDQISVLQDEAAKRGLAGAANEPDWRKKLTTALERFTQAEAVKMKYIELEESARSAQGENRLLKRRLEALSGEVTASDALKVEAEQSEARLRDKYDTLKSEQRRLRNVCSELNSAQAEMTANAAEHERLALAAYREKADADSALQGLQARYNDLKAKKKRKNTQANSAELIAQIDSLTADVNTLTEDLAKAKKTKTTSSEMLVKLERCYREQKNLSKELQRQYDKLSATNEGMMRKYTTLEQERESASQIRTQYIDLDLMNDRLKTTCSELEARNANLSQQCRNLRTENNDWQKTCEEVIAAADTMESDGTSLRNTVATLRNECRALEDQLRKLKDENEALRSQGCENSNCGSKQKLWETYPDSGPNSKRSAQAFPPPPPTWP